MSDDKVRFDYEVSDIDNNVLVPLASMWLDAQSEEHLEQQIEVGGYVDYPLITDMLEELEQPIDSMRLRCNVSGCSRWIPIQRGFYQIVTKATEYIVIYKLHRVASKHFKLRGFCVCMCDRHTYVLKDFDWDWSSATLECISCDVDHFSSRLRLLNRTSILCKRCRPAPS